MSAGDRSLLTPAATAWRQKMRAAIAERDNPTDTHLLDQMTVEVVDRLAEYGIDVRDENTRDQIFLALVYVLTMIYTAEAQGLGYTPLACIRTVAFTLAQIGEDQ